jgi:hypothetical protein
MVEKVVNVEGVLRVWCNKVLFAYHQLLLKYAHTCNWVLGAPTIWRTGTRSARHPAIPLLVSLFARRERT